MTARGALGAPRVAFDPDRGQSVSDGGVQRDAGAAERRDDDLCASMFFEPAHGRICDSGAHPARPVLRADVLEDVRGRVLSSVSHGA